MGHQKQLYLGCMTDKQHDSQVPRPRPAEQGEKAHREGALQEGLHLAPNQPPENSVLPPTSTGGEGGSASGGDGDGGASGKEE
jgi:hypothetical protein